SMAPEAIDPQRLHHPGSQMLYDLLQAARAEAQTVGPVEAAQAMGEEESQPDRLLLDLAERLYSVGLTVIPNLGPKNGMRIPLAIGHPDYPDELLVAVLTDNPDYVAEKSLRRRERHWLQRLKEYGWVVSIVYSTAVFMDPATQAQQLLDLVVDVVEERKKAQAQREAATAPAPAASPAPAPLYAASLVSQEATSEEERSVKRPAISRGLPLTAYGDDQLDDLLAWIRSDDKPRSVDEEVELLFNELGLQRRDGQVETILKNVVTRNA
ncbi:MAG: DNA helicase, partial [Varibaculum cambriense]|nr:DNA helicase [Varibaculum cambriense]